MTIIDAYKMDGLGNDFLIIDRRNKVLSSFTDAYLAEALIKELTC